MIRSKEKAYFVGYGWLHGITYQVYLDELLTWVFEDCAEDGTIIASNERTGEIVFVEGSAD